MVLNNVEEMVRFKFPPVCFHNASVEPSTVYDCTQDSDDKNNQI